MVAARYFSSDSFLKVLYNQKDYLLYLTDKDEMPDSTALNHMKLLFESMGSLRQIARQANKCFQDQCSSLDTALQSIRGNKGSPPERSSVVMIYSKRTAFFSVNHSNKSSVRGIAPVAYQNFDTRRQRERGSQPGGGEVGHQAHGKGEANAPQSAVKSKVLHSGTKRRWK